LEDLVRLKIRCQREAWRFRVAPFFTPSCRSFLIFPFRCGYFITQRQNTAATGNGVAFDHGKTEAALFRRKKKVPTAEVTVGASRVPFNKMATRWLGVWLDSQLTLRDHHTTRLNQGQKAVTRLRRLTGQMGLSPANCRKVMTACVQSVAMFGSELWWKGDHVRGTMGQADEL